VPLVGEAPRREAVDKVTAMQFDRHGNRIWRQAAALLDAEHARYAIGEVAVPYGTCTEPSNMQAGSGACPVRFRCAGCGHFRADVSHLPDLTAYLDDLLRTREHFAAAIDGVDEWARADATPAEEEITRIRRLITPIKGDIAQPTPGSSSGQRVRSRRSYRSSGTAGRVLVEPVQAAQGRAGRALGGGRDQVHGVVVDRLAVEQAAAEELERYQSDHGRDGAGCGVHQNGGPSGS